MGRVRKDISYGRWGERQLIREKMREWRKEEEWNGREEN